MRSRASSRGTVCVKPEEPFQTIMALCCIKLVMTPLRKKNITKHNQHTSISLSCSFFHSHCDDIENILSSILRMKNSFVLNLYWCSTIPGDKNVKTMTLLTVPKTDESKPNQRTVLGARVCVGTLLIHHYFSTQSKSSQQQMFLFMWNVNKAKWVSCGKKRNMSTENQEIDNGTHR